ncbi:uncharacterized protein LOC106076542 [Biomphalaria glabrata]|uniref:Uncharacterized protein LOC106076542 n=1 Tax=Biomphalaria glabrata TaxID=6526 RepID=A0A9W2YEI6_BIOGL|nr:uncharacterized protein LOC106076542 [Biomphalaria glabrata]XP_055861140.1 uncharacterized protein LOC106076542 [Biomphalaria glabrata]XP_055861141.1 uncharacterized protein LOC106076542 [Biomphalaria glabrata]XP_055861142.1 uncharacterized protein LOC106076542 [Biomphalaria glabrata]XP_055861143.1 uncharacterized protein LOC106076542 [Biomphalaria glabrata]XP_055861144.1 uncharacterized protein LOC106076542 [Biomphalaria glabrata]XP_055861145.1 uncharacterized protein LOC106076542 [Biomph
MSLSFLKMKWCWLLLVVTLVTPSHAQNVARQVCTLNGMTNEIGANSAIKLGVLFEMRNKGSGGLGCGSVNIANMQVYEAVKYAINVYNHANSGNPYLTNIMFGFKAYDTCYSTTQAISAMESLFPQLTSSSSFCQQNSSLLVGLVGPLSSSTAKSVAEFGGQYGVSIVSPAARDPALSNKNKYPTFVRTVPSYSVFAKAVAELLYQLQWQNVAVIYTNDDDGSSGYQQLLQAIYNRGLCITNALAIDDSMDKTTYRAALNSFKFNTFKVAIVVANSAVTQVILDAANDVMTSPNNVQWILSDLDITNDQSSLPQARGSLVVVPKFPKISNFVEQFVNYLVTPNIIVDNPWFTEWYSIVYKCSPTSGTSNCPNLNANTLKSNFIQSPWVVPAIKAVFAYVEAVRAVCLNSGSVCQNLRSMTPAAFSAVLRNLDVTLPNDFPIIELRGQRIKFDANGDPEISEYSVYNYNSASGSFVFEEIGTFVSDVLTLARQPTLYDSLKAVVLSNNPTVLCPALGCQNCLLPQRDVVFSYKQAEVVIATLAQAHRSGRTPFTCGSGIVPRLTALVAAEWAVGRYKLDNPGKLNGVSLGSLVADICPDSYVAKGFLTDLLSGNNRLVDLSGTIITPETIYAFVDLTESDVTKTVSPILSNYKIPEIEVVGTTTAVANGATTPYFTRAVPNDEVYYRAVSALLQSLGWKYVQVATYSAGLYDEMTQIFIKTAASYGICVVNTAVHFDTGDYNGMLMDLNGRSESQVVVVIGGVDDVRGLLGAINATGNPGQLQLVAGSDRWALNPNFVQGLESAAANTIVIDLEMPANVQFNTYLSGLTRSAIVANPFLRELFEITNRCSLDVSTRGLYTRTCTSADTNVNFYQGRTPYVIQSIYTVADKLHEIIQELCNTTTYTGLCSNFRSAPDIGQRLDAKLQNIGILSNGYGIKDGEGVTDYIFYVYRQGTYTKFAQFNTDSKQLSSIDTTQLANYQSKKSQCSGACFQCGYMFNIQNSLFIPGDWLIAGAFSVSNPGPANLQPYACGSTRLADGPQYTMAMLYALNRVNSGQASVSVPGVTFGGLALDHCTNPGRAKLMASAIYSGFMRNGVDQSKILAWITDDTASTNETAEILNPLEVAMVSPSATSARLLDFPNFYRTIQGDRTAALALVKIVKAFGFPYIQVVYGDDDYGIGGLEVMTTVSQSEGICITYSHKLSSSNPSSSIISTILTKGTDVVVLFLGSSDVEDFLSAVAGTDNVRRKLLILMPEPNTKIVKRYSPSITRPIIGLRLQRSNIVNYNNYINSLPVENPYFARYYMALKNCNLPGYSNYANPCPTPLTPVTNDTNYIEDNYILATINSVYAVVNALHLTVAEYCNQGYKSPCPQFYAAQDRMKRFNLHLKDVTFIDEGLRSFMFLDKEGNTVFEVLQTSSNGDYKQIGSYAGITLDLLDSSMYSYTNVTSSCIDNSCLVCVTAGFNFSHIPGDVYLAGIFDVHQRSLSPFTCGSINPLHGYLLLEAFNFAINQVNSKQGQFASILPNTRLGGIGLDACNSQVLGGFVVSNINSGYTTLLKDGMLISPSKIDAYIGSYSSKASIYLARILTDLKIPQISYAAGSQDLNDQRVYPFFYRTVPSDGDQVEAMLKFLDKMDIRYIQILHEDNSNGISAKDYLITRAAAYRICVAQTVPFPDLGVISPETSNGIVAKLLQKPAANTVVTFLSVEFVNSLLLAIGRSSTAQNKLRFVGSSSWADSQDAYRNAETWAVDSVTLKLDSNDVYDFETYMNSKTLANSDQNPWFEEYYQYLMNCYTSRTHTMGYPRACSLAATTILNSPLYQQDPGVVYVINAVYAAAFALDATLKQKCGLQYTAVCQAYRNSADRRVVLRNNLANVTFDDPSGNKFVFVNRSGLAGYKLNSVYKGVLGVSYTTIGSYNITTNTINISSTYTSQWDSNCDRREACAECPEIRDNDLRYVFSKDSSITTNATTIVGFFDIHKQGADPYRCGELNMPGFHHFLAFFYGAQKVVTSKVKGKVRILAIDTCSNSMRVDQDLFGLLEGTGLCNTVFDNDKKISLDNLGSVITMGDLNTMAAARVLEQPRVTYLSPNALSSYLDDYDYLLRTVAPNKALVSTLAALFTKLGWGYLDVVYQLNSPYGVYYYKDFNNYAKRNGLCEGSILGLDSGFTTADIKLNGNKGSKAAVLFGSLDFIGNVLSSSSGFIDQYTWILGGDWTLTTDDFKRIVPKGKTATLITLRRQFYDVKSFLTYLTDTLKYNEVHGTNTASIPTQWFDEFYQTVFNCTISTSTKPINIGKSECLKNQTYSTSSHDKFALNTIAAVFAAASGLEGVQTSYNTVGRRNSILQNTLSVSDNLVSPSASLGDLNLANPPAALKFEFDKENHWWNSGLEMKILSVSVAPDGTVTVKEIKTVNVSSSFSDSQIKDIQSAFNVSSICTDSSGCSCSSDSTSGKSGAQTGGFSASDHRNYYLYNDQDVLLYDWPVWAIVVAILTSLGLLITVILFLILVIAYPVRKGTTVLGYMVIVGILGIYVINFAFFVNANEATCGSRRFLMGVVYMIAFAPLLIKALDNWRFSQVDEKEASKDRYTGISSACSLFFASLGIVLVQCIIPIIWLILVHPTASYWGMADAKHDNWWCDPPEDYDVGIVLSMVFVMFIVLMTGIFSAITYDSERNNYESRWILFGSIATAGCFVVWMIVSTNAGPPYRDAAVSIGNLVNATLLMLVMPFRKSVLLCQSKRGKKEAEYDEDGEPNSFSNGGYNPGYELSDYDQYNTKPSEF